MAALREILVAFGATFDTKDVEKGLAEVEGGIGGIVQLGKKLAGAFEEIAIVGIVHSWVESVVSGSVELLHASERIGISAQSLKFWRFAGSLAGVEAGELDVALRKLSKTLGGAEAPSGDLAQAYKKMGLTSEIAHGKLKTLDEALPAIVENFHKLKEGPEQVNAAVALFGRNGAALIPFLRSGKDGLAKLNTEFLALAGTVNNEALESAEEYEQSQIKLGVVWKSLRSAAVSWLIPLLSKISDFAIDAAVAFRNWNKQTGFVATAIKTALVHALFVLVPLVWSLVAPLAIAVLQFALLAGAVDDFVGAWEGKDSLIGRIVDKVFGPGTTRKIVAWLHDAIGKVEEWWGKLDFSAALGAIGQLVLDIISLFGDGSKSSAQKFDELLAYIGGAFRTAMQAALGETAGDVITEFVGAITEVISAFKELWDIASTILHAIADIITATVGPAISWISDKLANFQAEARSGQEGDRAASPNWKPLAPGEIQAAFSAPGGGAVPPGNSFFGGGDSGGGAAPAPVVNMNVNVAPGTPQKQAQDLARAGAQGAAAGLKAPNRAAASGLGRRAAK